MFFLLKRGQVSIFIIIGILILIMVGSYFALYSSSQIEEPELDKYSQLPFDLVGIRTSIESCLDAKMEDTLSIMSAQGGFFITQNPMMEYNLETQRLYIPYYIFSNEAYIPSNQQVLEEFEYGFNLLAEECFELEDPNYEINRGEGEPKYKFFLGNYSVRAVIEQPVTVIRQNTTSIIDVFQAEKLTSFFNHLEFARFWTEQQLPEGTTLCYSCLYDASDEWGIETETEEYNLGDAMAVFYVLDKSFIFGHHLLFEYTPPDFAIDDIPDQAAQVDYDYTLQLTANEQVVAWTVDSDLFSITPDGVISFKPGENDVGSYAVPVSARSADGDIDSQVFLLRVEDSRGEPPYVVDVGPLFVEVGETFSYDLDLEDDQDIKYIGVFDLFTINETTGEFSFTPVAPGVKIYEYYVIDNNNYRVNTGEISIIIS